MKTNNKALRLYFPRVIKPPDQRWECLTLKINKKWKYYSYFLFCVLNYMA